MTIKKIYLAAILAIGSLLSFMSSFIFGNNIIPTEYRSYVSTSVVVILSIMIIHRMRELKMRNRNE